MKASKLIKSAALLFRGFTFATADEWLYLDGIKKYKRKNNIGMSDKEIFSLLPFDAKFDKLFGDVLSMSYALDKHTELLPEQYYSSLFCRSETALSRAWTAFWRSSAKRGAFRCARPQTR